MNQGFKEDEFAFLSDMLGPKGMAFDNDELLDDHDDEDLKNDPVSQMDMQVSRHFFQNYFLPEGVFKGPSRFFPTRLCNPQHNQFLCSY